VSYLNVWKAWQDSGRNGKWAHRHFLNQRTLLRAADIRSQLCHHLRCGAPAHERPSSLAFVALPSIHVGQTGHLHEYLLSSAALLLVVLTIGLIYGAGDIQHIAVSGRRTVRVCTLC
jgi:hypothetical protein